MEWINMDEWPRKKHFELFHQMDYPQINICMNLDATHFLEYVKKNHISFYYAMTFAVTHTANETEAFRYRIQNGKVVLYDQVHPSFTDLAKGSDLFKYVTVEMNDDILAFCKNAKETSENQKEYFAFGTADQERDDLLYITCLPWISFTGVSHPVTMNSDDAIPRIAWGKYFQEGSKVLLPFAVQVNHAIMDGVQIGRYVEKLQSFIDCL